MARLKAALVDRARVRRHVAFGVRVEGRSSAGATTLEWIACRLTVADAPELPDAEGGVRRIVQRAQLVCEPDADIKPSDEIEVRSVTLGDGLWRVTGAASVIRSRTRARAVSVPLARTTEAAIERVTT